jgi:hypothetical protein
MNLYLFLLKFKKKFSYSFEKHCFAIDITQACPWLQNKKTREQNIGLQKKCAAKFN